MFSEQDVDRELQAALSVSPSPEFEARVRQRVAADRPVRLGIFSVARGLPPSLELRRTGKTPGDRARGLMTPGLLAAASLVLLAGLLYVMNQPTAVIQETATPPVVARKDPPRVPVQAPPATKRVEPPAIARVRPVPAARRAEPEVILPVNQMEAVRRLADAVNEGRVVLTAAAEGSVDPPVEVVVAPIVVEPLPVPALDPDAGAPSVDIRRLQ